MTAEWTRISDPERIRALAHPLRLELLDYLREVREATATECADRTGESVASCSFHLRMLAKYDYIEPAERRGREKPWRLTRRGTHDMRPSPEVPGSLAAVVELGSIWVLHETERVRRFLSNAYRESPEWIDSSTITISDFWATTEEMAQLSSDLQRITDRFRDRADDPAVRPVGARRARLFAVANPDPLPENSTDDD